MTTTTENTLHKSLSDIIRDAAKVDAQTGAGESTPDVYEKTLPLSSLTMETVKQVSDHNTAFVAASTEVSGQLAIEAMKGNKEINRVTIPFHMGVKDTLTVSVDRSATYPNPKKEGESIVKFGATTVKLETRASHNSGNLKSVRGEISRLAAEALKD